MIHVGARDFWRNSAEGVHVLRAEGWGVIRAPAGNHERRSGSPRAIIRALNGMEAVAVSHFRWILASEPRAVY